MTAGRLVIAEVAQIRHTICCQVLAETFPHVGSGENGEVQLHELPKGKGINHKFHIPSGKICHQFAGKQLGVAAGDIDIAVYFHTEGVNALLPGGDFLYFIKEQIHLAFHLGYPSHDFIVQRLGGAEMSIAHIFKVQGDHLLAAYTLIHKLILDQVQHDRFSAAADTSQDLYQIISDKRTDTVHIGFSFNHNSQPPFRDWFYDRKSIADLQGGLYNFIRYT